MKFLIAQCWREALSTGQIIASLINVYREIRQFACKSLHKYDFTPIWKKLCVYIDLQVTRLVAGQSALELSQSQFVIA